MSDYLILFKDWVTTLGEKHGVDPLLLGSLYLISKVFFFSCLGWVFKNMRAGKPFVFQLLFASMSFSIPYLYLVIAGRNISVWMYIFIAILFLYGAYSIWRKVTTKQIVTDGSVDTII